MKEFYYLAFILRALKIQDKGMFANKAGKLGPFYYWTKKELGLWASEIATDRLNCWYGCAILRLKRGFIPQGFNPRVVDAFRPTDALGFYQKFLPSQAFIHEYTFDVSRDEED